VQLVAGHVSEPPEPADATEPTDAPPPPYAPAVALADWPCVA